MGTDPSLLNPSKPSKQYARAHSSSKKASTHKTTHKQPRGNFILHVHHDIIRPRREVDATGHFLMELLRQLS
ncbi:hypothetical protein AN958_02573 [Leucoagaricus sp. SymC.cos]|nr:hypothetical protein AN958_02573 [Leucoagaricus sp. SymC.cos]